MGGELRRADCPGLCVAFDRENCQEICGITQPYNLTPEGNLTLVDDIGSDSESGKQFITVVTKSGNYFYIIIDRDDDGENTIHFLNQVDEEDLLALMNDTEVESYEASLGGSSMDTQAETTAAVEETEAAETEIAAD